MIAGRSRFTYFAGAKRIPESSSPNIKNKSHTIEAEVEVPAGRADGVLVAAGGIVGGYALFIKDGKLVYEYNRFTQDRYKVGAPDRLGAGKHTVRAEFRYDGGGIGKGGRSRFWSTAARSRAAGSRRRSPRGSRPMRHSTRGWTRARQ